MSVPCAVNTGLLCDSFKGKMDFTLLRRERIMSTYEQEIVVTKGI
jgi:hypothetical protein